jgi:hypothetical protein
MRFVPTSSAKHVASAFVQPDDQLYSSQPFIECVDVELGAAFAAHPITNKETISFTMASRRENRALRQCGYASLHTAYVATAKGRRNPRAAPDIPAIEAWCDADRVPTFSRHVKRGGG